MDIYLDGVVEQAVCREKGSILDTESYTILRRKTSGVWPCFALIEFAARIDLPDAVVEHPLIRSMEEATNDWISWTNVSGILLVYTVFSINALILPTSLGYSFVQQGTSR